MIEADADRLASRRLCEHAVHNLERAEEVASPAGLDGFFDRTRDNARLGDRVRRCMESLKVSEAICIADAPSLEYVRGCRKFALLR
jgi:hypothetical protein